MNGAPVVVLFHRDLRVHDHPALAAAAAGGSPVVPLFVLDDDILARSVLRANRLSFLRSALLDLDRSLRDRGSALVLRRGDAVRETVEVAKLTGARTVQIAVDHSGLATRRERRLERAVEELGGTLLRFPSNAVVQPAAVRPAGGDHYKVFTPYWRAWQRAARRPVLEAPGYLRLPSSLQHQRDQPLDIPRLDTLTPVPTSPDLPEGGEGAGRARMAWWLDGPVRSYDATRDHPAEDGTSRLSAYLHFGCVSALELAALADGIPGAEPFARQLAWRDFFTQVLAARPGIVTRDYRPARRRWTRDPGGYEAWVGGTTGHPLVDAAMHQLQQEGWVHNRTRMLAASFLTKQLGTDWRLGATHFDRWLVDGDTASNVGNWQWAAGVGNDTRPNRVLSPARQAARFDPEGKYVARYLGQS